MIVEIDSLGASLQNFEELRNTLIAAGLKFDAEALSHIPYEKLILCATGVAGEAMCSLKLVQEEKALRRSRFLSMGERDFEGVVTLLRIEQMYDDVIASRTLELAPRW